MCYIMTENLIGNNIRKLRKARKLTQEQLAEMVHISHNYLAQIESGRRIGSKYYQSIANALDIDLETLLDGEIPAHIQPIKKPISSLLHEFQERLNSLEIISIPVIGFVPCGDPFPVDQFNTDDFVEIARQDIDNASPDDLYALTVSGNSLKGDDIFSGDVVIVDRSETNITDGKIYIVRIGNDTCARHVKRSKDFLRLYSSNNNFQDIEATGCEILGRVILSIRSKKH